MPPPLLQNFTSRHYHYLIPRHNHRASIIITRNRRIRSTNTIISTNPKSVFTRNWAATSAAFSFSVSFFFPFSSSSPPPFFHTILVPSFLPSNRRRHAWIVVDFLWAPPWTEGKLARGKPVYIHGHVEAAKRGKIVKVYLVCHRDDYRDVVVVSLRRFSFLPSYFLSLLSPLCTLERDDALSNEFFRSSVIATMFNFSIFAISPVLEF